jgi:ketosteroid isomerase-like protein
MIVSKASNSQSLKWRLSMHQHEELITRFYEAFSRRDGDAMAACYHDEATFSDPVFVGLDAEGVREMWRMLTTRGTDLRVEFRDVEADDARGSAHWEAWYTFSTTGKQVHNIIEASFEFRDGKIVRHVDEFGFWRWSRQALGVPGLLLGWTPIIRGAVRSGAGKELAKWRARAGES